MTARRHRRESPESTQALPAAGAAPTRGDGDADVEPHLEGSGPLRVGLMDEASFEASLIDSQVGDDSAIDPLVMDTRTDAAAAQPAWVGKQLGHFRLLRLIGRGSMGLVIQARDVNLHRIVALKVLRKRIAGMAEADGVDQFLREARAAAQIEHPNIVRIYEISQHEGWWYIAMEMIEGETLRDVVKAVGKLAPERACPIVADAATALAVAHESGIIHRDIKPNNVMITRTGRGKLADFGLVRLSDPDDPFDFTNKSVGTPQYMAPEIIQGERATPAVDVYGLGGTLFYALTGHPPYTGTNISAVLKAHCAAPVPDLRERLPKCTDSLCELVRRMMAKDPTDRPTAQQAAAALRAETIASRGDDSGVVSGVGASWTAAINAAATQQVAPQRSRLGQVVLGAAIAAVPLLLIVGLLVYMLRPVDPGNGGASDPPAADPVAELHAIRSYLAERFVQAPVTWGEREPGSVPAATEPESINGFGWRGRVDVGDARFVAARRGTHYWPIDHPIAGLILADDVVAYDTAAAARADGKRPAAD